jgi:hypothetical protein
MLIHPHHHLVLTRNRVVHMITLICELIVVIGPYVRMGIGITERPLNGFGVCNKLKESLKLKLV